MTIYYQFSGPSDETNGFDPLTLKYLIKDNQKSKNVLVIASDLHDFETTDFYFKQNLPWFDKFIPSGFNIELIDGRINKKQAQTLLEKADCIHLMGGYTEKQTELLEHFKITKESFRNAKVVFGTSAGAMALGPILMGTNDKTKVLEGMNCVEGIIWPHYQASDDKEIKELLPLYKTMIAIADDTGIRYENNKAEFINTGYKIYK